MPVKKNPNAPGKKPSSPAAKRSRTSSREARNDTIETSPIVMNAARVLDHAMKERGLSPAGLNEAVKANTGAGQSEETIRLKRNGQIPLSLVNMEEYARALQIPVRLFIEPISETKFFFAREAADLEAGRDESIFGGRDQGLRMSTWNTRTPAYDPEIDAEIDRSLASVGS